MVGEGAASVAPSRRKLAPSGSVEIASRAGLSQTNSTSTGIKKWCTATSPAPATKISMKSTARQGLRERSWTRAVSRWLRWKPRFGGAPT
jgi:hypothetical protein